MEEEAKKEEEEGVNIRELVSKCSFDPTFLLKSSIVEEEEGPEVRIVLSSAKMGEMAQLLTLSSGARNQTKLNMAAIQLQLTAQSSLLSDRDHHVRGEGGKRSRRISGGEKRVRRTSSGEED